MQRERYVALDSWRGLCAVAVAVFHYPLLCTLGSTGLIQHAYLFVDFFFVLSGFVIARSAEGRLVSNAQRGAFLFRRIGRLWPLHMTMLLLIVAVSLARGNLNADEQHSLVAVVSNTLMIHAWGLHQDLTWNDPSWSISVEWMLYLLFAGLSLLRWRKFLYAVLVVAGIATLLFLAPSGMGSTYDYGAARGLAGFFTGALVAAAPIVRHGLVAEALAVAAVAIFVGLGKTPHLAPFVFGAAVHVFAGSKGALGRVLNLRPFVWLGERSYSIYMVHATIVACLWALAPLAGWRSSGPGIVVDTWVGDVVMVLYLAAVVAFAAITYRFVEKPGIEAFKRLSPARRAAVA